MAVKSLREQLAKIALKKVKMSNGETLAVMMAHEVKRLYNCIQYYIDKYYESYEPIIYERTYHYQKAFYAENLAEIRVVGDIIRIGVAIQNDLAMHSNLSSVYWQEGDGSERWIPIKDLHESFVPLLMEKGWYAPRLSSMIGRHVPRVSYFAGINAVERGIEDFNKTNKFGLKINADDFFNGKAY